MILAEERGGCRNALTLVILVIRVKDKHLYLGQNTKKNILIFLIVFDVDVYIVVLFHTLGHLVLVHRFFDRLLNMIILTWKQSVILYSSTALLIAS